MKKTFIAARSFCKTPALVDQAAALASVSGADISFVDHTVLVDSPEVFEGRSETEVLVLGRDKLGLGQLEALPNLKHVVKYGVGIDNIDLEALAGRQIELHWRGGVNAPQVAELTIGLMLGLVRNIALSSSLMRQGIWRKEGGRDLGSKVVAVVGCGHVGSRLVPLLSAFGCQVLICDIKDKHSVSSAFNAPQVSLDEALSRCDIATFHVPLSPLTENLISGRELRLIGPNGYLVNTSRGKVVDMKAVGDALDRGDLGGAAFDVYPEEPFRLESILSHPRVVCTPHIGGGSEEARHAMGSSVLNFLEKIL